MFRFPVSSGLGLWVSEGFGFRVRVSGFRAWGFRGFGRVLYQAVGGKFLFEAQNGSKEKFS